MVSLGRVLHARLIEPMRQAQGAPDSIARGAALGIWIALTPTVGAQMVMVAMLAIPLRANIPVALALVWISNPVTMVPLYFCFYWLGNLIVRQPQLTYDSWARDMGAALATARDHGWWAGLLDLGDLLGSEVLWPMAVGSFIMATAAAIPTYHLVLGWAHRRRNSTSQEDPPAEVVQERMPPPQPDPEPRPNKVAKP